MSLFMEKFDLKKFDRGVRKQLERKGVNIMSTIKDHQIDTKKANQWVNGSYDPTTAIKLLKCIQHVSFADFKYNLYKSAISVIKSLNGDNYGFIVPTTEKKSNTFFTSMVYNEIFYKIPPIFSGTFNGMSNNGVIVDDCTYSGSQLTSLLKQIAVNHLLINNYVTYASSNIKGEYFINVFNGLKNLTILNYKNMLIPGQYFVAKKGNYYIVYVKQDKKTIVQYNYEFYNINELFLLISKLNDASSILPGEDIKTIWFSGRKPHIINIHLCIPYISTIANDLIDKLANSINYMNIIKHNIELVPSFQQVIGDDAPLQSMAFKYFKPFLIDEYIDIIPIYFDHKIASPVSCPSIILNCGLVIGDDIVKIIGPIVKNCYKDSRDNEILDLYREEEDEKFQKYNPEKHEDLFTGCPIPPYKITNYRLSEIKKSHRKSRRKSRRKS